MEVNLNDISVYEVVVDPKYTIDSHGVDGTRISSEVERWLLKHAKRGDWMVVTFFQRTALDTIYNPSVALKVIFMDSQLAMHFKLIFG